jgi:hypothetical protein
MNTPCTAVQHMLKDSVAFPPTARLIVIVVGDEAVEAGDQFARVFLTPTGTVAKSATA